MLGVQCTLREVQSEADLLQKPFLHTPSDGTPRLVQLIRLHGFPESWVKQMSQCLLRIRHWHFLPGGPQYLLVSLCQVATSSRPAPRSMAMPSRDGPLGGVGSAGWTICTILTGFKVLL